MSDPVKREDGLSFEQFERECNNVLFKAGVPFGINDLADATWRDYYDCGMPPRDAVECANDDAWDGELSEILHG